MPSIGETLAAERRRQNRNLADAAAETRVRESYLAAIEEDDFDVLGGDVYAKGFVKLYAKYLGIDPEPLIEIYRRDHEKPEETAPIPGDSFDDWDSDRPAWMEFLTLPVIAAVGIVLLLTVGFIFIRNSGTSDVEEETAGPEAAETEPTQPEASSPPVSEAEAAAPTSTASPAVGVTTGGAPVMNDVSVAITATNTLVLNVTQGQPPVSNATLQAGDVRTLSPVDGAVVFSLSDLNAATISVNGQPLVPSAEAFGQTMQITCQVGETSCQASQL